MFLLPCVFLGDLQFDSFVGAAQSGKQRRHRLPHLKINWPILDLNDGVVVELSIERMKIIVRGLRAIVLRTTPTKIMVVNKCPIKNYAAVRLERVCNHVRGISVSASVSRRSRASFGIGLHHKAAEIRKFPV